MAFVVIFVGFMRSWVVFAVLELEIAKEKVETRWGGKGVLCLVLGCAVKRGVAYCMRDCEEFPCEKYFEWCFPYGKDYLEMHINRAKDKQSKKK